MIASLHILVVDDDPQIGGLVKDYLEQHGFRVSTAHNGQSLAILEDIKSPHAAWARERLEQLRAE